jgi:hypothetical protein
METSEVRDQMRIYAIEILLVNVFASFCMMTDDPLKAVATARARAIAVVQKLGFPFDAAMSDLCSAELETALDRLMEMATGQITQAQKSLKGRMEGDDA